LYGDFSQAVFFGHGPLCLCQSELQYKAGLICITDEQNAREGFVQKNGTRSISTAGP
jgi:hypothetical protein